MIKHTPFQPKERTSTSSESVDIYVPLRHDFGIGLRSCSFCEAPRCFNRGCKETGRVICEECWPGYVIEIEQSRSIAHRKSSKFGEKTDEYIRNTSDDMVNTSAINICRREGASQEDGFGNSATCGDREDVPMMEACFESSLSRSPLRVVIEGAAEKEQGVIESSNISSAADSLGCKTILGVKEKTTSQSTVMLQPGLVGVDFRDDVVTFVTKGSQADRVGIRAGWKIRELDGSNCNFLGDERMQAARNGNTPYIVTFVTTIEDNEDIESLAPMEHTRTKLLSDHDHADLAIAPPIAQTHEVRAASSDAMISDLDGLVGKLQESQDTKANIALGHSRADLVVVPPSLRTHVVTEASCDVTISDLEAKYLKERENAAAALSAIDEKTSRVSVQLADIERRMSSRASHDTDFEYDDAETDKENLLARTPIRKAMIDATEKEFARNIKVAEDMIKSIQRNTNQIEVEEAVDTCGATASFSSCGTLSWFGESFSAVYSASQHADAKRKSWFHRWLYAPSN